MIGILVDTLMEYWIGLGMHASPPPPTPPLVFCRYSFTNLALPSQTVLPITIDLPFTFVQYQECKQDSKGRYMVHYTATVRITHVASGSYREDVGANDSIDKSLGSAVANAMKGAVTDAMKRAARHFGEKLGNCTSSRFRSVDRGGIDIYILLLFC